MLVSYKWLQSYFKKKLPLPEALADAITFGFAEIESIEQKNGDFIFDLKVLPDRACYALSHRGVAHEVSAILGFEMISVVKDTLKASAYPRDLKVTIEAPELCARYTARAIEGSCLKSERWIEERLESVGQRLIHPVVDCANFVMFDMGQPLHAFDADKVDGGIIVRRARKGEKIITLDNKEISFDESILVIADEKVPLAIAGIKGGTKACVSSSSKNFIIESANFDASYIRKTAEKIGIKTDASKRFENRFPACLADDGNDELARLILQKDKNAKVGNLVDKYPGRREETKIFLPDGFIDKKLGMEISDSLIEDILSRLLLSPRRERGGISVIAPKFRQDLSISEDIAEEVGRIYGYEKIRPLLPIDDSKRLEIPKQFYYEWKTREILVKNGFSEIMTSSFSKTGQREIKKPLADDKRFARADLRSGFEDALKMNLLNAPVLGLEIIRLFEIGRVFLKEGERVYLAIGVAGPKKKTVGILESVISDLSDCLGVKLEGELRDNVFECRIDEIFAKFPEPKKWDISIPPASSDKFNFFSAFPFIVRDIALFVPSEISEEEVKKVIGESAISSAKKSLAKGPELFDRFEKDGRKSFAFRLVFQADDRTLTDADANNFMEKVNNAVKEKGWQVR